MRKFIVVSTGHDFAEAMTITADSKEDAVFSAGERMRGFRFALVLDTIADADEIQKYITDHYSDDGWNYICQTSDEGVAVGWSNQPFYANDPHDVLEVCEAVNRLANPNAPAASHIIIGTKLPKVIMSASCYYCGDSDSTSVYF